MAALCEKCGLNGCLVFQPRCVRVPGMNSLLGEVPIFAGLNDVALEQLLKTARQLVVPAGEVIVREGEIHSLFYVIGSGSVRVCKNFGQPQERELITLGPHEFFGEMCILEALPRAATVQATTETTLFGLSAMAFYHLYKMQPAQYALLVLNIARDLSRRLRRSDEIFAARH